MGRWWERWKEQRRRRRELPGEYEALAREFALITARCLEAEQRVALLNRQIAVLGGTIHERDGRIHELEMERKAIDVDVPGLTPGESERLAILGEECGEVMRAIGKIQRYGFESTSPFSSTGRSNRMTLEREIGSLRAVTTLMLDAGDVRLSELQAWQRSKKLALAKWTLYQECSMERRAQLEMMRSIVESVQGAER